MSQTAVKVLDAKRNRPELPRRKRLPGNWVRDLQIPSLLGDSPQYQVCNLKTPKGPQMFVTSNRKHFASRILLLCLTAVCALAVTQARAQVTLTEVSSTQWTASNGILTFDFNPTNGGLSNLSVTINGTTTNWLEPGESPFGHAVAFYPLNGYSNVTQSGPTTSAYHLNGYLDIWSTKADLPGKDPLEIENHWVIRANDPGIHFYQILRHFSGDGATAFGNAAVNFFCSGNAITQSDGTTLLYQNNTSAAGPGVVEETFPTTAYTANLTATDPGRQVEAETVDYTASTLGTYLTAPGLAREFITKYDYSTYQQNHLAHGYIGGSNAFWWVVPSPQTFIGGPTKQYLTGIEEEYESAHLGGENVNFAAGQVANRFFGPIYLHFNGFNSTLTTAADLYNDAVNTISSDLSFYDSEGVMTGDGYRARANRGTVDVTLAGNQWSGTSTNNVIVLSDNTTNFQLSAQGYQYWGYADSTGKVTIPDVMPGTYRVSAYVLGGWGLYHIDNIVVGTGTTNVTGTFDSRSFSSQAPVWTIGYPDRTAHEYSHGHRSGGFDSREYPGRWNYWSDVEPGNGAFIYTIGTTQSYDMPYVQWNHFYTNIYAGVYGGSTSGTNGYSYITPQYVITGAAAEGVSPQDYSPPSWQIQFTATSTQVAQGPYVLLSINLAANDTASLQVQLNGKHSAPLKWYPLEGSDPEQRSGVSGYNNYAIFQFNTADLLPAGQTNIITVFSSGATMYDALKLEIGAKDADPAGTGWPEYDWLYYNASDTPTQQSASAP
jgi:hypothetical protein